MAACPRSVFVITPEASVVSKVRSAAGYRVATWPTYRVARSDHGMLSSSNHRVAGSRRRATSNCRPLWLNRLSPRGWLFTCLFLRKCRQRHCSKNRHERKGNQKAL
jgi:hypothetical protein